MNIFMGCPNSFNSKTLYIATKDKKKKETVHLDINFLRKAGGLELIIKYTANLHNRLGSLKKPQLLPLKSFQKCSKCNVSSICLFHC